LPLSRELSKGKMNNLNSIAKVLVAKNKGILAADESLPTIKKRFDQIGIESTEENRRSYREMLFTTPGIEEFISGVILFDETVYQKNKEGIPFPKLLEKKGIAPGIKVDEGKEPFGDSGEMVTRGIDTLAERLNEYMKEGLKFTKWRAVFKIGDGLPSKEVIDKNVGLLAEFAFISQQKGFVPIVEPEVLMDGEHNLATCEEVTKKIFSNLFSVLEKRKVNFRGMLLKPNMVVSGKENSQRAKPQEVAGATLRVLERTIHNEVPGIVFLSGGQSPEEATANLNAINSKGKYPWELSFSFGRALQKPALLAWKGKAENVTMAKDAFYKRAKLNSLARQGKYRPEMEND
jgi:fructose-bisphosphate aldolase class I